MLTIDTTIQGTSINYTIARAAAQPLAEKASGEAMLIAWFDAKHKTGHPDVEECTGDKPGWLAYAESHGGNLAVNINGGEFIFIFATGLDNQGV